MDRQHAAPTRLVQRQSNQGTKSRAYINSCRVSTLEHAPQTLRDTGCVARDVTTVSHATARSVVSERRLVAALAHEIAMDGLPRDAEQACRIDLLDWWAAR